MGQNPVRTPDGLNRISGGGGGDTPTPDLVVGAYPDSELAGVIGSGMKFDAGGFEPAEVSVAGFGFTEAEALASLSIDPVPGFPVPATPVQIVPGSIVAVAPVGAVPGTITCQLGINAAPANQLAGVYTLSVTTAAGKTGGVRVELTNPT